MCGISRVLRRKRALLYYDQYHVRAFPGADEIPLLRGPAYWVGNTCFGLTARIPRYTGYMRLRIVSDHGTRIHRIRHPSVTYEFPYPLPKNKPPSSGSSTTPTSRSSATSRQGAAHQALLEEQRQALVHQAVTRGLDPSVRLKPSGVEWLGQVPEHWETLRVRHFSKVGNGCTPQRDNAAYWTEGVHPWLNSSSVNQGTITKADQFVTDLALSECHLPRLRPGSVLVGITGQGKTRGMSAVLCMVATINQHMAFITLKTGRVSSHYLHMYLTAAYSELRAISNSSGSTKDALTCEDIKHFMVVLPPRDEQERLLSEVRRELASVDNAVDLARRQIGPHERVPDPAHRGRGDGTA